MAHPARKLAGHNLELVEAQGTSRYEEGWRAGKPVEDPEKMKRWGYITAKPSEYLVVVKRGKIDRRSSGQGARVFKWPWESVSVIPTTLQRVEFQTDQITLERVGVRVTGIAVFRIVDPEIAFRVLNFSFTERAGEKLADTMREMFIGAARRLIANLSLDECLTKRKEAIAKFLMAEIAPVVSGRGSPEDTTDRGWGVVIDTIEIQDVKIQSEKVFNDLQATFRAALRSRAAQAELDHQREVAERQADTQRLIAEASIENERQTRMLKARAEAEAAETEAAESLRAKKAKAAVDTAEMARREALERQRIEMEQGLALRAAQSKAALARDAQQLERERQLAEIQSAEEKRRAAAAAEQAALEVEAELADQSHEVQARRLQQMRAQQRYALETENALDELRLGNEEQRRRTEAALTQLEESNTAAHQLAMVEVEQQNMQERVLIDLVNRGLPSIAAAFKQTYGTVNYTQLSGAGDGDGGPMGSMATAFAQIMTVAKGFGLDPAKLGELKRPPAPAAPPPTKPKTDEG